MGLFRYEAVDGTGKVLHGAMNAASEQHVAQVLAQKGYSLRAVYAAGAAQTATTSVPVQSQPAAQQPRPRPTGGMASVTLASGVPVSVKSVVPAQRLAMFFRQLSTLVKSGLPLYQSLSDVTHVTRNGRLRQAIPEIQQAMQSGQSLSGAMAAHPSIFPAYTIASVWSGELSGKLDIMLDEIAADLEQEASDTRFGRIGWGLTKITLISIIALIPLFNVGSLFAPIVAIVSGGANPASTDIIKQHLDSFRGVFLTRCLPVVLILCGLWIAWGYMKRLPTVRRVLDGIILRMPVWGRLHRYRSIARFLHVMEELTNAGVSVGSAWSAASNTARNSEIVEKLHLVREHSPSAGMADLVGTSGVLEPEEVGLIAAGEKSGQIPDSLSKLAASYRDRADAQKPIGRMWSVSLTVSFQLAIGGAVLIYIAKTYAGVIYKMIGF